MLACVQLLHFMVNNANPVYLKLFKKSINHLHVRVFIDSYTEMNTKYKNITVLKKTQTKRLENNKICKNNSNK